MVKGLWAMGYGLWVFSREAVGPAAFTGLIGLRSSQ